jgi:multidrug efflux pump subunit AcrA (membrane-fusion protein)
MQDRPGTVEFARKVIQRRAQGKSLDELLEALGSAQDWERQASRHEDCGPEAGLETEEWERIAELVRSQGASAYDVSADEQAQTWIAEREARDQAQRERAQRLEQERQERAREVEVYVRLSGPVGEHLQALARGLEMTPERVLVVLAEHVEADGAGRLRVPSVGADSVRAPEQQREDLARLDAYVRGTVLPGTHAHTMRRRQVLEALGEAGGLCTAQTVSLTSGDVILCTLEAGHFDPDDLPGWKRGIHDGTAGGWHRCDGSIWDDSASYSRPHIASQ